MIDTILGFCMKGKIETEANYDDKKDSPKKENESTINKKIVSELSVDTLKILSTLKNKPDKNT